MSHSKFVVLTHSIPEIIIFEKKKINESYMIDFGTYSNGNLPIMVVLNSMSSCHAEGSNDGGVAGVRGRQDIHGRDKMGCFYSCLLHRKSSPVTGGNMPKRL